MNAMTKAEPATETGDVWEKQEAETRKKRMSMRRAMMLALPVLLVAGGGYVWVTGGRYQETENAYLRQAKVTIASDATGRIIESNVIDNGVVHKGDVLFVVDPEPYRIALAQADASLAAARLNIGQLRATYSQALAQQQAAANDVAYYEGDAKRQGALATQGIATRATLDETTRNLTRAKDALAAADEAVSGALAALGGDPGIETDRHPAVQAALAAREK
ncbi:MAG: biotin/lipoyl-binding protein, partial [Oricola sp.]